MQKMRIVGFVGGLLLLAVIVLGGTYFLANSYLASRKDKHDATCQETGAKHTIVFKADSARPAEVQTRFCDTLTIINSSGKIRRIAFGQHNNHKAYDGVKEKYLPDGKSFTVTLNEKGDFIVHDHLQEEVGSIFTVE